MISHRANLFESINKQMPKVVFGQTWIEIIDPKPFNEISDSDNYKSKQVYLLGYAGIEYIDAHRIQLMGITDETQLWAEHEMEEDNFNKIPKTAYRIISSPLQYKYKIGQLVYSDRQGNIWEIVGFVTGEHSPESKEYLCKDVVRDGLDTVVREQVIYDQLKKLGPAKKEIRNANLFESLNKHTNAYQPGDVFEAKGTKIVNGLWHISTKYRYVFSHKTLLGNIIMQRGGHSNDWSVLSLDQIKEYFIKVGHVELYGFKVGDFIPKEPNASESVLRREIIEKYLIRIGLDSNDLNLARGYFSPEKNSDVATDGVALLFIKDIKKQ
jgi:hypothetical protein